MTTYNKILGNLLGAAIGDAMGGPTEERTTDLIKEYFGGYVTQFIDAPMDTWAHGAKAGMVTDDFSLAYFTAKAMVDNKGVASKEVVEASLLKWSEYPEYFDYNVGPTTRAAVNKLKGIVSEPKKINPFYIDVCVDNTKSTNGAAMKIGPIGLFSNGDVDHAIAQTVTVCMPTHPNDIAISGACAVSAAVAKAMAGGGLYEMADAAIYGAREGMRLGGKCGNKLAGPSVEKRIYLACDIGVRADGDWEKGMCEVRDIIGNGLSTVEAVPAAFGLMMAAKGDILKTVYGGVNIGGDTDTIACIAGAMAGTYSGYDESLLPYLQKIEQMNGFDLRATAKDIEKLLK